jgi:hypothetical protein
MKKTLFFTLLCLSLPLMANAEIVYRVEQIEIPRKLAPNGNNRHELSDRKHYYIGASYNYTMWQDFTTDTNMALNGNNTSSFDIVAGLRLYDTFRLEANYINSNAKWDSVSFNSNMAIMNLIWDARIDSIYRIFDTQILVPYVGFGAGASWNYGRDSIIMEHKFSPVISAMAGISVEFNELFALDFGYKYIYMFNGANNIISDFAPTAHQLRAGARIHF